MGLISNIKCSRLYCKMQYTAWTVEDKIKDTTKNSIKYAKEHPVKTTMKTVATIYTFYQGGHLMLNIYDIITIPIKDIKEIKTINNILKLQPRESDLNYTYHLIDQLRRGGAKLLIRDGVKFINGLLALNLISKDAANKAIDIIKQKR